MKTVEQYIDDAYQKLFDKICELHDDLYELKIEYKEAITGKTIIRSWRDREVRLRNEDNK